MYVCIVLLCYWYLPSLFSPLHSTPSYLLRSEFDGESEYGVGCCANLLCWVQNDIFCAELGAASKYKSEQKVAAVGIEATGVTSICVFWVNLVMVKDMNGNFGMLD